MSVTSEPNTPFMVRPTFLLPSIEWQPSQRTANSFAPTSAGDGPAGAASGVGVLGGCGGGADEEQPTRATRRSVRITGPSYASARRSTVRRMPEAPRVDRPARDPAHPLDGATVVVGVAGGIAAYKAVELVRQLDKAGATVHVAMTARAQKFVTAMTFQALTRHPVFTDLFSLTEEATIGHIQLADRADLVIVAPATANAIARLAMGRADDAVTAIVLATKAPVLVAPSMNVNMWTHPLTQANVKRLIDVARYRTVGPGSGFLACQWTGPGRLAEPADIVEAAAIALSPQDLAGKRVVVTAGRRRT